MQRLRLLLPPLLLAACLAQVSRDTSLQITVLVDGENEPTSKEITVTLLNEWSEVEAVQTTNRGMLSFLTSFGIKRVRITAPDLEQFDAEFVLDGPMQGQQTFVVSQRVTTARKKVDGRPIAAVRMGIPKKAMKRWEKAEKKLKEKRLAEAKELYEEGISLYPQFDLAYYGLAKVALAAGDRSTAKAHLRKAIELNSGFNDANRQLADILINENDYAQAEPLLLKAVDLDPDDAWSLTALAMTGLTLAKLSEAISYAQRVHGLPHARYATSHLIAARALEASWRHSEALAEYRLYLREEPEGQNANLAQAALQRLSKIEASPKR